ncbi:MAG TPA: phosphatase PAP2 family protein [Desulfomonilia bacterium]|nr:phosphatase PAP2 family protein [Desulfomonilia bacterium]
MIKKYLLLALIGLKITTLIEINALAQDTPDHPIDHADNPGLFDFLKKAPSDLEAFAKGTFSRDNIGLLAGMTVITGVLVYYDEPIVKAAQRTGDKLHISHETSNIQGLPFLEFPRDFGSALYFLGDGAVDIGIAGGFLSYGWYYKDSRALHTTSQLAEGLVSVGVTVQLLKHLTGRTSPASNDNKDRWRPFVSPVRYHKNVSHYDAMPSGHLASSMLTVTVIAENYPEYTCIRPLGYTLMSLCGFQMLNNGVHWISDYPLALYIGYSFGMLAAKREHPDNGGRSSTSIFSSMTVRPIITSNNDVGMGIHFKF